MATHITIKYSLSKLMADHRTLKVALPKIKDDPELDYLVPYIIRKIDQIEQVLESITKSNECYIKLKMS